MNEDLEVMTLRMQLMFMKNYSYLIIDHQRKEALVVDPSWEEKKIREVLEKAEVKLSGILLTHSHWDHRYSGKPLAKWAQCPVWMSKKEIDHSGFRCPGLVPIPGEDPVSWGPEMIRPLFTPGHSPGGLCYLIQKNLFTGDTLFSEGCGACFSREGNPHLLYESLQRIKREISKDTRIFPGHSYGMVPGKTMAEILTRNIYLKFENVDDFVAHRMRKGQRGLFRFQWGD